MVRSAFPLGLLALSLLAGRAVAQDPAPLDLSSPSFTGLDFNLAPSLDAPAKTADCEQYLRLNGSINPDRFQDHCAAASLTVADLQKLASGMRSQRRGCGQVARLKIDDYRQQHQWESTTGMPTGGGGGPSPDFGIQWTLTLGTGRQRLRLRTPAGSVSHTLRDGRDLGTTRLPRRSERHPLIDDARAIRDDARDDLRRFDLPGVGENLSGENLATYGAYEAMRKLQREAASGSSTWERRAAEAGVEQGDCERYWDNQLARVLGLLGGRR